MLLKSRGPASRKFKEDSFALKVDGKTHGQKEVSENKTEFDVMGAIFLETWHFRTILLPSEFFVRRSIR